MQIYAKNFWEEGPWGGVICWSTSVACYSLTGFPFSGVGVAMMFGLALPLVLIVILYLLRRRHCRHLHCSEMCSISGVVSCLPRIVYVMYVVSSSNWLDRCCTCVFICFCHSRFWYSVVKVVPIGSGYVLTCAVHVLSFYLPF